MKPRLLFVRTLAARAIGAIVGESHIFGRTVETLFGHSLPQDHPQSGSWTLRVRNQLDSNQERAGRLEATRCMSCCAGIDRVITPYTYSSSLQALRCKWPLDRMN